MRYRWTGREYDAETGWYFHRARYYDPQERRFVQEDPMGYGGGGNLYAYVSGQVLEARDPSGTYLIKADEESAGSGGGQVFGFGAEGGGWGWGGRGGGGNDDPWWQNATINRLSNEYDAWVAAGSRVDEHGNWITQNEAVQTRYLHLSSWVVSPGQHVEQGQLIGFSGSTGRDPDGPDGPLTELNGVDPHLHFEVRRLSDDKPLDPLGELESRGGSNPLDLMTVTAGGAFGVLRDYGPHQGVDLRTRNQYSSNGRPVYAAFSGTVVHAGPRPSTPAGRASGNTVWINHY